MFIHWGLYALPARHEWVKSREMITDENYEKYFTHFNPDLYDPEKWAKTAKAAGMKYFVITTKHHDGFCLWDSAYTDYKATNTPYGKDLIRPMVEAFRKEGLKIGFYHSLIDWHHPHFTIDRLHPLRDHPDAAKMNKKRDMKKYTEYLHNQVEELLAGYGKIDILWFDFSYKDDSKYSLPTGKGKKDWQSGKLLKLIRKLQPGILINNRLEIEQDITTPEQYQPREWVKVDGKPVVWEACQTFSGSWGYFRDEETWKSPEQLIQMLINSVSCGGNLLMNVGPNGRGEFDNRANDALGVYEEWMRVHEKSIYNCTASKFKAPLDCRFTQNGKKLYLHIFSWPFKHIHLDGLAGKVAYAQFLNDASEVRFDDSSNSAVQHSNMSAKIKKGSIRMEIPIKKPGVTVPVIELFLK
ncbi:MAG: alpha-L-fucosidase [Planctomycetota bacterium]